MKTIGILIMDRDHGERMIQIRPHWRGAGIAIHHPIAIVNGKPEFRPLRGYWRLTHIPTGLKIGACAGSLGKAKSFAMTWDAEFAALLPGQAMAPDRIEAWLKIVKEMQCG